MVCAWLVESMRRGFSPAKVNVTVTSFVFPISLVNCCCSLGVSVFHALVRAAMMARFPAVMVACRAARVTALIVLMVVSVVIGFFLFLVCCLLVARIVARVDAGV